jgi:3-deoxy-D-manno-octulosonic-acid transferase
MGEPLVTLYLNLRKWRGKEDAVRLSERFGYASIIRPRGQLIWLHAASIGEAMSLLKLLEMLHKYAPNSSLLLTTGTVTSAKLLAEKLPAYVMHQFFPVDTPASVKRFLEHWQPTLAVLTESELWPNMILECVAKEVKLALINARMSEKSFSHWQQLPEMIGALLAPFSLIAAQTHNDAKRYQLLGAIDVVELGNLKHDAEVLSCDEVLLAKLRARIAGRPCVVAASVHPQEDELIAEMHQQLHQKFPTLLTIMVPRHPNRGAGMQQSAKAVSTQKVGRRSEGDMPDASMEIFIADSIGELGLWYRLADVVVMGGSFIAHGGQNPLEPARLRCPIIVGPHMHNFAEITAQLVAANAMLQAKDLQTLCDHVQGLLNDEQLRADLAQRAYEWLQAKPPVAEIVARQLVALGGFA